VFRDAAKEIKNLINASAERVEQGTALVDQAGVTMTEVVTSIRRVTDLMGEIGAPSVPALAVRSALPKNLPCEGEERRAIPRMAGA